jgi:phage antirepressor YoqD-like protein
MTSREIADLVEKRHDNVIRTIENLVIAGVITPPQFEEVLNDGPGPRMIGQCRVGKRDSYIIVAQLSPEFTARLVDRWQELDGERAAPQFQIPTTLSGALRLAAEQAEIIERQSAQIEAAAPAVEFVGRYVESESGSMGFRQVCKLLRAKEPEFRAFLHDKQIMYKLSGDWWPYAAHIDAGRLSVKTGTANQHAFSQAKFTAKGIEWIAGEWAKHQIKEATQ